MSKKNRSEKEIQELRRQVEFLKAQLAQTRREERWQTLAPPVEPTLPLSDSKPIFSPAYLARDLRQTTLASTVVFFVLLILALTQNRWQNPGFWNEMGTQIQSLWEILPKP